MAEKRNLTRRSFLSRVAGGAALGGMALAAGQAAASDTDPSDPATPVTDRDSSDAPGRGRGTSNGHNDQDSSDRPGRGRSGQTDQDPTDGAGRGRGPRR